MVLTTDERGEIDDTTKQVEGHWLSGSLYEDSNDILRLEYPEESDEEAGNVLMFLLSAAGGLQVRLGFICVLYSFADPIADFPPAKCTEARLHRRRSQLLAPISIYRIYCSTVIGQRELDRIDDSRAWRLDS